MSDLNVKQESGLAIFNNPAFGIVRGKEEPDGTIWVVAKDVATALEYAEASNTGRLFASVPASWKGVKPIHTPGGMQEMLVLYEQGLYFFLARSDKPKALPFQIWLANDVVPSIRKTGSYAIGGIAVPNFSNPAEAARAWADEYEKRVAAQKVIEEQAQTIEAQEIALGDNRDWKAVTAIPWLKDIFADTSAKACNRIGRTLAALSRRMGMEIRKAEDDRWGTVNVYHITVINYFKQRLDNDLSILRDIRKW